eukprot:CAMPEP_0197040446 /NCGR_PEP_ID=MMETSP1384-20130603/17134_1 /TAXON_ID=29189 /ORGANISM="Ammonia sp." /LENGTH=169 /DNA_ID=CAMNT_0042471201 /DNA_START=120 /DNA_END=629 /DNA_ORIENTATION=-
MMYSFLALVSCLCLNSAVRPEFNTYEEAQQYVSEFLVYEDHLKAGNVNENFEFIQKYISKDFVYCFGGDCIEGRDDYIKSLNSLGGITKDWTFTVDVKSFGRKYLTLYTLRSTTFGNGEIFTFPAEATLILNEEGKWKYWMYSPFDQKYIDEYRAILQRNAGVQKKDDL